MGGVTSGGAIPLLSRQWVPSCRRSRDYQRCDNIESDEGEDIKDDCGNLLSELVVWGTAPPTEEEEDKEEGKEDVHHDD